MAEAPFEDDAGTFEFIPVLQKLGQCSTSPMRKATLEQVCEVCDRLPLKNCSPDFVKDTKKKGSYFY